MKNVKINRALLGVLIGGMLSGCSADKSDTGSTQIETAVNGKADIQVLSESQKGRCRTGVGNYLFTDSGIVYTKQDENGNGDLLYYFDEKSGISVALCSKGNCSHNAVDVTTGENIECNAQIIALTLLSVYNGRIYYLSEDDDSMDLAIKSRDMMGTDDKKAVELSAQYFGTDAWNYGKYIFVAAYTDVSGSFDAKTRESDSSRSLLFAINLENGDVNIAAESEQIETSGVFVLSGYDGNKIDIYRTYDKKCFNYDLESGTLSDAPELTEKLADKHIVEGNPDGNTYFISTNSYMYGVNSTDKSIMQLNMSTGEEEMLYSPANEGEEVGSSGFTSVGDEDVIIDIQKPDFGGTLHCFYLDTDREELTEVKGGFTTDHKTLGIDCAGDNGFVYSYPVDMKDGQAVYDGKFELRFMSIQEFLGKGNEYKVVY